MKALIASGVAAVLLSGTALADPDAPVMMDLDPMMTVPMEIGAGFCQDLELAEAHVAVEGPVGVTTVPMTRTGPHSFAIAQQAGWPAIGHFRLIWAPAADAPENLMTAVDVTPDLVLLDGLPVAEAFAGGHGVATAIRDVPLAPGSREVTVMLGWIPEGSTCAHAAVPATLTVTADAGIRPIDTGIGNGALPGAAGMPAIAPVH